MKVFIVIHGEKGEGGSVFGVYADKKSAVKEALTTKCCFPGGWAEDGDDEWENGCDFVRVEEWEVEE